ncbi:MAG TPA: hypothetical protein VF138_07110 [Caulobacteraceae bacterium]
MPEPDRTALGRRLALGAVVLVALIVLAVVIARGRPAPEPSPEPAVPPPTPATNAVEVVPQPLPLPTPPLGRKGLIEAVGRAASAYSAGVPVADSDKELVGQRFRIGIPFGCGGPAGENPKGFVYWTRDAGSKVIRLVAKPQDWTKAAWAQALGGDGEYEAIEGFWLPRPWTASQACAPGLEATAGERTLALAMFFEPGSSRVLQRSGRPYEHVLNAPDGEAPIAPKGYRLMLEGRITGFPDGQAIRCRAEGANTRPVCMIAVRFEDVSFEDPVSGSTLAEWRNN